MPDLIFLIRHPKKKEVITLELTYDFAGSVLGYSWHTTGSSDMFLKGGGAEVHPDSGILHFKTISIENKQFEFEFHLLSGPVDKYQEGTKGPVRGKFGNLGPGWIWELKKNNTK